jgi:hypothetical protein
MLSPQIKGGVLGGVGGGTGAMLERDDAESVTITEENEDA